MSSEALLIDCASHGQNYAAVICGHLVQNHGHPLGFIENVSDRTNPQGWCLACEYVFVQEQEMTDVFRNFNQMAMVCIECYDSIKNKHNIYPYPSV